MLCPVHPFASSRHFPSRGNEGYGEKNRASYTSCTIPVCPPLVAGATTFPPAGGLYSSLCVSFILPPLAGEVRRSRKGGGERSEPIRRMLIMPYDTESQSRNADFISIARRAIHHPRPEGPSPPERSEHNPPPTGGHNLRPGGPSTFPFTTLLHNLRHPPRPFVPKGRKNPLNPAAKRPLIKELL